MDALPLILHAWQFWLIIVLPCVMGLGCFVFIKEATIRETLKMVLQMILRGIGDL